jgi:stress response protein YsnF
MDKSSEAIGAGNGVVASQNITPGATPAAIPAATPGAGQVAVPVIREELDVTTRVVDTGRGVRVTRSVTEQPVEISEQLWHEELDVQRVAVDRVVAEVPPSRYEGDVLVVPVVEEILVIEKRFRIKEELRITRLRRQQEYRETVSLRAEDVQVEAFDEAARDGIPNQPKST